MEVLIAECGNIRKMATKKKAAKLEEEDNEEEGSRRMKHEGKKTVMLQCTQLSLALHLGCLEFRRDGLGSYTVQYKGPDQPFRQA
jgi:hypothetical protein